MANNSARLFLETSNKTARRCSTFIVFLSSEAVLSQANTPVWIKSAYMKAALSVPEWPSHMRVQATPGLVKLDYASDSVRWSVNLDVV